MPPLLQRYLWRPLYHSPRLRRHYQEPDVKAVLMAWYPGQQGGLAISEIITGKISPSGKLPISIEKKWEDNPVNSTYYENVDRIRTPNINPYSRVEYREGLYVGYRGYEKNNVEPLFPFGFGLSYTLSFCVMPTRRERRCPPKRRRRWR